MNCINPLYLFRNWLSTWVSRNWTIVSVTRPCRQASKASSPETTPPTQGSPSTSSPTSAWVLWPKTSELTSRPTPNLWPGWLPWSRETEREGATQTRAAGLNNNSQLRHIFQMLFFCRKWSLPGNSKIVAISIDRWCTKSGLIFGRFFGNSTQLELAVFEFFGDFVLSFFWVFLEFWVFSPKAPWVF